MNSILEWICGFIYEFFYALFLGKVISFPTSHISVAQVSSNSSHIGEGAFSIVLKVKDIRSGRFYAVKRMLLQSSEHVDMVRTEVDAFKRFQHRSIVPLLDVLDVTERGSNLKSVYLLLPYYSRGNLRDQLNLVMQGAIQRPGLRSILRDFKSICEAVQVLHSAVPVSYVHYDIKPEVTSNPALLKWSAALTRDIFYFC